MSRLLLKTVVAVSMALAFCLSVEVASAGAVVLGVNSNRDVKSTFARYGALVKYLETKTGTSITLRPLKVAQLPVAAANGLVTYVLANPVQTAILKEKNGFVPLASVNKKKSGSQFGGVILAKKGSGIKTSADLQGKRAMSLKFNVAAGAYMFQAYHLLQKGYKVHDGFFSMFMEGKSQPSMVLAVKAGMIDVAFIRTGMLESMAREGQINMDDFVIVDQHTDSEYPLPHSTELYPDWSLSAAKDAPAELSAKVQKALLALSEGDEAAKKARLAGFVEPLPTNTVLEMLKALKVPPFDK